MMSSGIVAPSTYYAGKSTLHSERFACLLAKVGTRGTVRRAKTSIHSTMDP